MRFELVHTKTSIIIKGTDQQTVMLEREICIIIYMIYYF